MNSLTLRTPAVRFLLLQRTGYQRPINKRFRRAGLGWLYDRYLIPIVERHRVRKIAELYRQDLQNQFDSIIPYLPKRASRILDIGAGLGGIVLFFNEYYSDEYGKFYLLDKNEISEKIYYYYEKEASYYNSFDVTVDFLLDNGMSRDQINIIDVGL